MDDHRARGASRRRGTATQDVESKETKVACTASDTAGLDRKKRNFRTDQ